jgi:hypothetical protein
VKAHAVVPAEAGPERLVGWVLCHDVHGADGGLAVRKGTVVDPEAARRLVVEAGAGEVHLVEMEAGDVHEEPAGERLAAAAAGAGVKTRDAGGGQWALVALRRGLLRVDVGALTDTNTLEGVSVYTLYDGHVVEAGEVVGRAKVTPLVVAETVLREAETRCERAGGVVSVRPFRPLVIGAVAPATLSSTARARFDGTLREKLGWLGARLGRLEFVLPEPAAFARAMESALREGAEVIVAAGANALDPLDPVFAAVERLGGRLVRRGVPAHPGSLLWMADLGGTPLVGMPSCGMFSQATLFDLILPRLLAGERVGAAELAAFGHGGLLGRPMAFRFPPYRAGHERGALPE